MWDFWGEEVGKVYSVPQRAVGVARSKGVYLDDNHDTTNKQRLGWSFRVKLNGKGFSRRQGLQVAVLWYGIRVYYNNCR